MDKIKFLVELCVLILIVDFTYCDSQCDCSSLMNEQTTIKSTLLQIESRLSRLEATQKHSTRPNDQKTNEEVSNKMRLGVSLLKTLFGEKRRRIDFESNIEKSIENITASFNEFKMDLENFFRNHSNTIKDRLEQSAEIVSEVVANINKTINEEIQSMNASLYGVMVDLVDTKTGLSNIANINKTINEEIQSMNVSLYGVMKDLAETKTGLSNLEDETTNNKKETIFEPDLDKLTCQEGERQCHADAICVDYSTGFCCSCVTPTFGNGKHCVNIDSTQRLKGTVSGSINGIDFDKLDMHSFVLTKDGRTYTAINRVPNEISSELMTLNTIGGIVGWMFALQGGPGAKNGFMFTGGGFNRTARIRYQNGDEIVIEQKYHGPSVLSNIRMETVIKGNVPKLDFADKITIGDYSEEYKRVSPGVIRSTSDRVFHVNNVAKKYTWEQVINYEECAFDPSRNEENIQRLSVTRNVLIFDTNDRIVRFAMSNKIQRRTDSNRQPTPDDAGEEEIRDEAKMDSLALQKIA